MPELLSIAVKPACRRLGIGKQFLTMMEDHLSAQGHPRYCVFTDNEEGIHFYQKYGFKTVFQFRLAGVTSACFVKEIETHAHPSIQQS